MPNPRAPSHHPPLRRLRRLLRPLAGRESRVWKRLPFPRLRYRLFGNRVDCLIHSLLASGVPITFVQIGAHDGRTLDPLWTFRAYPNWSGLLVEALPGNYARLRANYARWQDRFRFENSAVTTHGGTTTLFEIHTADDRAIGADQLGSLKQGVIRHHLETLPVRQGRMTAVEVRCLTFEQLCARHDVTRFDLLNMNVEGSDLDILRQIDFSRFQPHLIKLEHSHLSHSEQAEVVSLLETADYQLTRVRTDFVAVRSASLKRLPLLAKAWQLCGAQAGY